MQKESRDPGTSCLKFPQDSPRWSICHTFPSRARATMAPHKAGAVGSWRLEGGCCTTSHTQPVISNSLFQGIKHGRPANISTVKTLQVKNRSFFQTRGLQVDWSGTHRHELLLFLAVQSWGVRSGTEELAPPTFSFKIGTCHASRRCFAVHQFFLQTDWRQKTSTNTIDKGTMSTKHWPRIVHRARIVNGDPFVFCWYTANHMTKSRGKVTSSKALRLRLVAL